MACRNICGSKAQSVGEHYYHIRTLSNAYIGFSFAFAIAIGLRPSVVLSKIASIFRTSANFTFYSHPIILELIKMIYVHAVSREINSVFLYSVTVILTFAASFALQKLNNKFLNKFIQ
jgi:hypothetical protein